jgi:hypothetical protein
VSRGTQPSIEPVDPARASTNTYAVLPAPCDSTSGFPPARQIPVQLDNHRRVLFCVQRPTPEVWQQSLSI